MRKLLRSTNLPGKWGITTIFYGLISPVFVIRLQNDVLLLGNPHAIRTKEGHEAWHLALEELGYPTDHLKKNM